MMADNQMNSDNGVSPADDALPVPLSEQTPMDDDAGGPTVPAPEEDEAAKLGDFA